MTLARRLAGPAISLVCLAAVVAWAVRQERPAFPAGATGVGLVALAVAAYAAETAVRGGRWHHLLRRTGIEHDLRDAYALVVVGYMGNNVLPARGGEALRTVLLSGRSSARWSEVVGSIFAERLLDVAALALLLTGATALGVARSPLGWAPLLAALVLVVAAAVALAGYVALRRRGRFERFAIVVRPFAASSRVLLTRTGASLLAATLVIWLLEAVVYWLVGRSLAIDVDPLEAAFLVALTSFVAAVPAAPGYVGTFDAALLFGLDALGVAGGEAVGFLLLVRFVVFVPITLAGLGLLVARYGGARWLRSARPPAAADVRDA